MASETTTAATRIGIATSGVMIAQQVAAKATRDALFLSHFDADELLRAMLATAALSGVVAMAMAALLSRMGPARVVPAVFLAHAALFMLEWWLVGADPGAAAIVVYLHVGALGATAISGFWSVVNERFDPHAAKGAIASIGAGATVGGVGGGLLAERVSSSLGVESLLPVLAALNVLCAGLVLALGRGTVQRASDDAQVTAMETLASMATTPLLRKIVALVVLTGITAAIFDYTLKAEADAALGTPEQLASFFAAFYTVVGLLTFVVQASVGKRLLSNLGLSATIALLPATVLLSSVLGAAVQRLWSAVVAAGAEQVLRSSVYRAGYELLYTPMAPARKRPAKALIDVAFDRLGDALGAGLLLVVVALMPEHARPVALLAAGVAAVFALIVSLQLHKDYVGELARSLRSGAIELDPQGVVDATTMQTLADTATAINRDELLREIGILREEQRRADDQLTRPSSALPDGLRQQVDALLSSEPSSIAEVLERSSMHPSVVALSIPLLEDKQLGDAALQALARVAGEATGQLGDAVVDPTHSLTVRVRLARLLGRCATTRSRDALVEALQSDSFELRYHAVQALLTQVEQAPELAPDRSLLASMALRELQAPQTAFGARRVTLLDDGPVFLDAAAHGRIPHALEHVVSTMALWLDREPLRLCLTALHGDDAAGRGTALEYLQNVLTPELYGALLDKLPAGGAGAARTPRGKRDPKQIVADLQRSTTGD